MEGAVYVLCAVTALACSVLLLRGWLRKPIRLLLWCSLFFAALAAENAILFIDVVLMPSTDLALIRNSVALTGVVILFVGLAWETK